MFKKNYFNLIIALSSSISFLCFANQQDAVYKNIQKNVSNFSERQNFDKPKLIEKQTQNFELALTGYKPFLIKNITIYNLDYDKNIVNIANNFVNKQFSSASLKLLRNEIISYLISQDYLLPKVKLVKIDGASGIVYIKIELGKINDVILLGDGDNNPLIASYIAKISAQNPSKISETQKYIGLINKIPGLKVSYELKEVQNNPDKIDLILDTKKKKAAVYIGSDNYGINRLGKMQNLALAEIYSPFGKNDAVLFHAFTSNKPNRLANFGIGYTNVFNSYGTVFHALGSYGLDNPTRGNGKAADNSKITSLRYGLKQPLIVKPKHDLELSIDNEIRKSVSYVLDKNNNNFRATSFRSYIGEISLKYILLDNLKGKNLFKIHYFQALNGKYQDFLNNAEVDKKFKILKAEFYREQSFTEELSALTHLAWNHSDSKLPSFEKSSLGGREFGRGYALGSLEGNSLAGASIELRYSKKLENLEIIDYIQPYLFHDYGTITKKSYSANVSSLSSGGGGLRFKFIEEFEIGFEVAVPFKKNFIIENSPIKAETNYGIFFNKLFEF